VRSRPFSADRAAAWPALIGVDEVGRGALCGPVLTAAVWFDPAAVPAALLGALDDSKRLTARQREAAAALVHAHAEVAFAAASAGAVDRLNVRAATLAAMARAVARLGRAGPVLVDGRDLPPGLGARARALVGGDALAPQIAAASIVAKVRRDRLMARLGARWPDYGWGANAGYGAAAHMAALARHGATPHHRRSFAPVAAVCAAPPARG
jgi:ribonuclease HII